MQTQNKIWSNNCFIIPFTSEIKTKFLYNGNKIDHNAMILFMLFLLYANWNQNEYAYRVGSGTYLVGRGELVLNLRMFSDMLGITKEGCRQVVNRLIDDWRVVDGKKVKIDNVFLYVISIKDYDFLSHKKNDELTVSCRSVDDEFTKYNKYINIYKYSNFDENEKHGEVCIDENLLDKKLTDEEKIYGSRDNPKKWQIWKPKNDKDCLNDENLIWAVDHWDDMTKI